MKLFKIKTNISKQTLAHVLLVWIVLATIVPNIVFTFTESICIAGKIAGVFLPLGVYCLLMSLTPKVGKSTLWMTVFSIFSAFQMVLLYLFGRSPIAVDMFLNVVTTNPNEAIELLGNLLAIIIVIIILYLTPIIAGIVACVKHWRATAKALLAMRYAGFAAAGIGLVTLAIAYITSPRYTVANDLFPCNAIYNMYLAVDRSVKIAHYDQTSADFSYHATSTHPDSIPELYVLVVGETGRSDHWQLCGYNRPTNPRLSEEQNLTVFTRAITQSNTTHKSVPMLLSALDANNFGDSLYCVKSVATAFREAGFYTAFISNQRRNHSLIDIYSEQADTCIFIRDYNPVWGAASLDMDLLDYADNIINAGHRKTLIILHTYGSHFSYADRYPEEDCYFTPDYPMEVAAAFVPRLINGYDNTIRYTDRVLSSVIDRLKAFDGRSAMIYSSDHGEDLLDDRRHMFLHASPVPSYYQLHVPFAIWLSDSILADNPEILNTARAHSDWVTAPSASVFHTLIDISGLSTPWFKPEYSVVNPAYTTHPLMYLNDHNEGLPLRECNMSKLDFEMLDKLGL